MEANTLTPQEKAEQIIKKFYYLDLEVDEEWDVNWNTAKSCARVLVEEILNTDFIHYDQKEKNRAFTYWQQIKNAIELA